MFAPRLATLTAVQVVERFPVARIDLFRWRFYA